MWDDERLSYDLQENQQVKLNSEGKIISNGMTYYKTDYRFDDKTFIRLDMMKQRDDEVLVLFAHEWALGSNGSAKIETAIKWLVNNNYEFSFLDN
ncbi:MAG: hypothetical protein ACK5LV_04095 [Lachnospirales bacterium]